MDLTFGEHDTGEVRLHYAEMGPKDAPLILCLHGFPEYWAAWKSVMGELAGDFRLVAPDQRGFNVSSRPREVEAYRGRHLVADIASLADHLSPDRPFVLAGHDWGAAVAYAYAFRHAARLSHLVIANGVHPWCFQNAILGDEGQRAASQYINILRAPEADARMAEDGFRRTFRMIEGFSQTDWMTPAIRQDYLDAWSRPGAMTGMLNWYRAAPIAVPQPGEHAVEVPVLEMPTEAMTVAVPHLVLWGAEDTALTQSCLDGLDRFARDLVIVRIKGAGHWILHEKPAEVAEAIRDFLRD